jgi:hypothetical protein
MVLFVVKITDSEDQQQCDKNPRNPAANVGT